jgi:hypothetical protein
MLIDDCAKYLNATLVMNDECPVPAMRRIVHTILFGEYPWQPLREITPYFAIFIV